MIHRHAFAAALCLTIGACGDGDTDSADDPFASIPVVQIIGHGGDGGDGGTSGDNPTLGFDRLQSCSTVGEAFEIAVSAPADGPGDGETRDVSASVTLTPTYSDALEVLGQGDDAISLRMNARDIAQVRIELDDSEATGKTIFVAGFTPDTPGSVLMRKFVPGGCLLALRMPEVDFCRATLVRQRFGGAEQESFAFGSSGRFARFTGCDHELPDGVSFLELADTTTP